jgi:hypothetical protein
MPPHVKHRAIVVGAPVVVLWLFYIGREKLAGTAAVPSARETASVKATAKQDGVILVVDGKPVAAALGSPI